MRRPSPSKTLHEQLEDRILFDAVPDGTLDQIEQLLDQATEEPIVEQANPAVDLAQQPSALSSWEIVFVDKRVEQFDTLVAELVTTNRAEVVFLDPSADGLDQMVTALSGRTDLNAIHIISHGAEGILQLGNTELTADSMQSEHLRPLTMIGNSLSEDGDILVYGCDFAGGDRGLEAAMLLGGITGADIAASEDVTGSASLGGDWELEYSRGQVEARTLSSQHWFGTLAVEASDGAVTIQDAEFSGSGSVTLSNNGDAEVVTTVGTPQRVGQMLERIWMFNETADTGRATLVLDVSGIANINATIAAEFGLIISDQADLSGSNTTTLVASGYDSVNQLVYFHQVDLQDGDYFGFATKVVQDNFTVSPVASGFEDTNIDLGLELYPSLTEGGQLRDIIGTEIGFRPSTAGAAPTDFLIPAGTTGIKITAYSTRDIGTSNVNNDATNDDYQSMHVSINLDTETSNGFIAHLIDQGPSRSDQFGWSDAPLGSAILSGGGTIIGDANDNIDPRFEIVDGVLRITENHQLQTAYHVEFLTNATSSADFIQTATAVREDGDQSLITLAPPANADFLVINITDAATSSNSQVEYKGNSRIYVDLNSLQASGVVSAQRGETDDRVLSYAFEDYDISSAAFGSILSAAGSIVGDITENAGLLNDNQIYLDGSGNLVIDRNDSFASNFNSMITVEYYERKDAGSSASQLGESTAYGLWNADPSDPTSTLEFDIPEHARLGILNLSMNGTRTSDTNENMGAGFAVIDLESGFSSGSIYMVRTSNIVDLVGWDQTAFGTPFFDDPNSVSNHSSINNFNDKFAGNAVFNLTNGGNTLELSTHSPAGTQSYLDYYAAGQIVWYGNAPLEITGYPTGGTFDKGALNPDTGNWSLTLAEAQTGLAYVPPEHFSGSTPIDVTLIIGDETEVTSVTVQAVIDPISFDSVPDAVGDEDTDISISANVTPTFVDQDGSETLTAIAISAVPVGHTISDGTNTFTSTTGNQSVDITAWNRNALTYRANPEESGTFTLTLTADWQDVGGGITDTDSTSTTFDVIVNPVNDLPVAVDDFYTVLGNTTLNVNAANGLLNNDSDLEGDMLSVDTTAVSGPSNGSVVINTDGSFSYTPNLAFSGTDSFVYRVSDGNGGFDTATAYIDVSEPVTGPLNAVDDGVSTNEETSINIVVMDNDQLPITGAYNVQSTTPPSHGTISVLPDGSIDYTPDPDFFGDDSFTYTLADASGRTSTATVTVTVNNVQDPPSANADSGSTNEDTPLLNIDVLSNDSDPDGDLLTVTNATASNGSVVINLDGTLNYTPNAGFFGSDTINYSIDDGNGGTASSSVLINVSPVADPPTSVDNTVSVYEDSTYVFAASDFAFADEDPGDTLIAVRIDTPPANGQLLYQGVPVMAGQVISLTEINASKLTFIPDPNDFGTAYASFDFSVSDGVNFQTTPNTITIDVLGTQDAPVATSNSITADEESSGTPLGLTAPTDPDGDALTATVTGLPTLGIIYLADGTQVRSGDVLTVAQLTSLLYDAPSDYDGVSSAGAFTYTVSDGSASDSGEVAIDLVAINDAPHLCVTEHTASSSTFIDDRSGFESALTGNSGSTVIDDANAFEPDPSAGTFSSVERNGAIGGDAYAYEIYDIDFSNTPNGTLTPGSIGGDIFDLDNVVVELPASQGTALGSGTWGVDTGTGSNSTRNALLFDFTTTPGGAGIGHFAAEFHDFESDPAFTVAEFRVYRSGVLIDSGTIDWGAGNNGNNESHFFGYTAGSPSEFFHQIVIVAGDDGAGGGLAERLAADRFTFGGAYSMTPCDDYQDTFVEGGAAVPIVDADADLSDVDDTTFPSFTIDVDESTIVDAGVEYLSIGGTDFLLDAAADANNSISFGGNSYDVTYIASTAELQIARTDGSELTEGELESLLQSIAYRNDSALPTEADRVFEITVNDGDTNSNIATSTIAVIRDAESAQWNLTGPASVVDGKTATYTLTLSDPLRLGETASVEIRLTDVDTTSADYASFSAAVASAVSSYSGPGNVSWNGIAIAFTSDGTGSMSPLDISLSTSPDGIYEGDEDFTVSLSNPASTTGELISLGSTSSVTTTIRDNQPAPTLSISDGAETEGGQIEFVLSLDVPSHEAITLNLVATSGSATANIDFETTNFEYFDGSNWLTATSGTQVTLPAGTSSLQVRVATIQDGHVEADETFTLGATLVSGTVSSSSDTGQGTIINDDVANFSINDVQVDEDNGTITFTISLDQPATATVSVDWATASGSAASGIDFVAASGTATFAAGTQSQIISVALNDDNTFEGPETFDVNLTNAIGGTIVDGTGVGTLLDDGSGPLGTDDDRPEFSITDVTATEDEDAFAVFTIDLTNPSAEDIELALMLSDVSASSGSDYGPGLEFFDGVNWQPVGGNVIIAAGQTQLQVRTPILDDFVIDNNETYTLSVTRVSGTTQNTSASGTGTILDDPTPDPTDVRITGPGSVSEGSLATYTVELDNTPLTDVTVTFTYSGTASGGTDYSGVASVQIPAGSTTGTFSIPTIDDVIGEPLEEFIVTISSVTGGSLEAIQISTVQNSVTTQIIDDDTPSIGVNDVVVTEGYDPHAEFTVELSNPTFEAIDFSIAAVGVTATGNNVDFGFVGVDEMEVFDGTNWVAADNATIASGTTALRMRTPIVDDVFLEPIETFTVTVTTTSGTTLNPSDSGTGTIQDDSTSPETVLASIAGPSSVVEGNTTTDYTVTLRDSSSTAVSAAEEVTVTLTYSGTATDGNDFTGVATVTISAGSSSGTFSLATIDDSLYEISESIVVTIDSVTGGGFEGFAIDSSANSVTTTVTDTGDIPTIAINNVTAIEGTDDFAIYTIEVSNLSVEDIDFNLSLTNGTAIGLGEDFGSSGTGNLQVFDGSNWVDATTATISAGEMYVQVRVPIINDTIDEPAETYSVTAGVTAGTTTNAQVVGVGTILDDDPAPDVSVLDATATEGDALIFEIQLTNPSSQPIDLNLAITDTTTSVGDDYAAASLDYSVDGEVNWLPASGGTQVSIPANTTSVLVRLNTTEDNRLESTETLRLAIDSIVSGTVGDTSDTAVGTIEDDDVALVSIVATDAVAGEPADPGQFTVSMSNPSDVSTTISYTVNGSAVSGSDFAPVSGTIVLPAGVTSGLIDLTMIDDSVVEGDETVILSLDSIVAGDADVSIDPVNNSATITLTDDDTATWQLDGVTTVNEGENAVYQLDLLGTLQSDESTSVELSLSDFGTNASDYSNFSNAVADAVSAYSGSGTLTWNGSTLTFTSDGTGQMSPLLISLAATNETLVEGAESYALSISNAVSATGIAVSIAPTLNQVTTEIQDTTDALGTGLDTANWSITGPASVVESSSATFLVSLDAELQSGEMASVDLTRTHIDTTTTDLADWNTAVTAAVSAYNATGPGTLAWNGATLTFTADGTGPMGDLAISLSAVDDGFLEGPEDFGISLSSASSTTGASIGISASDSVTTTILASTSTANWAIGVDSSADEGATVGYNVSLAESLGAGDSVSVDVGIQDITTNSSDYANFVDAVLAAVGGYAGPGSITFDGTTLTYTASVDGDAMSDLNINLQLIDDDMVEGTESFQIHLTNPAGPTGVGVSVNPSAASVSTSINDTQGIGGAADQAVWSISGPSTGAEGADAVYSVELSGAFGAGEQAQVVIQLSDGTTTNNDYGSFVDAISAAASLNPHVQFDSITGTLTYTAPSDGASMAPLTISLPLTADSLAEGPEDFSIQLTAANSPTGASVTLDGNQDDVSTTITDSTPPAEWSISGPAFEDEGGVPQYFITLSESLGAGEQVSVTVNLTDVTTNASDYGDFVAAMTSAVSADPNLSFDAASGVLTFTATTDGQSMSPIIVELPITDDVWLEGPEQYSITLSNATSATDAPVSIGAATVTTTINDSQGLGGAADGPGLWSITGDLAVAEGTQAQYTIRLSGQFGANESASVDLSLSDIETNSSDHAALASALSTAVANYAGPGSLQMSGDSLIFTAGADGDALADLSFQVDTQDDSLVESDERFEISLANSVSSTGAEIGIDSIAALVTTTIEDNDIGSWNLTGETDVVEGLAAEYTLTLAGILQSAETATVDFTLTDIATDSSDYAALATAVNAGIAGRSDLTFDGTTLTYTGDGNAMMDLVIQLATADDSLVEGDEDYSISISNSASTTGSDIALGVSNSVTTLIEDNDTATWSLTGDSSTTEGLTAGYTLALSGVLQSAETATVDFALTDIATTPSDYTALATAINTAISGRSDLVFDGTTLTYTGDGNAMMDLFIQLATTDDSLVEGDENYTVAISSAASTTGSQIVLAPTNSVTTTIEDNDTGVWQLAGPLAADEGSVATYTLSLQNSFGAGVEVSVDMSLSNLSSSDNDYASFEAAMIAAVTSYNASAQPGTLTWNAGRLSFLALNDGDAMSDLQVQIGITDDAFSEGPEQFFIELSNPLASGGASAEIDPTATSVTTTINDTQGAMGLPDGPVQFFAQGDSSVDEGGVASYEIGMQSTLGAGETVSVDLAINNLDTASNDYSNLQSAINAAVSAYSGPGNVNFDGTTLTFTALNDGESMSTLGFDLSAIDDSFVEGPETFEILLSNANSTTDALVTVDASRAIVATTIRDTIGDQGQFESVQWNLAGDASVIEGNSAAYTISLDGQLQSGETATIQLNILETGTTAADRETLSAAVNEAILAYTGPGVFSYDPPTDELRFTSDGNAASPLVIDIDALTDNLVEGPERYTLELINAGSTTDALVQIDATRASVETTIQDEGLEAIWQIAGDASSDEGDIASYSITMLNTLQAGEIVTVELTQTFLEADAGDVSDFNAAVATAVGNYNSSVQPGSLNWDGTTLAFTSDGSAPMGTLSIELSIQDDTVVEGPERYHLILANPQSSTGSATSIDASADDVLTTIRDTVGPGGPLEAAVWSIGIDQTVLEGDVAAYVISLTGDLQSGEVAAVNVGLTDLSTASSDYANFSSAITTAVNNYNLAGHPGTLAWNGTELRFTSDGSGAMAALPIQLATINDVVSEGIEDFRISLSDPASTTGIAVQVASASDTANTAIDDTAGPGADAIQWSLSGDSNVTESATASYTLSMSLGAVPDVGERMSVTLGFSDLETDSGDRADAMAAIALAVSNYAGPGVVGFDSTTGILTFENTEATPTRMGDLTFDILANDDSITEGPERYELQLSSPGSDTGLNVAVTTGASNVVTTIEDNDQVTWQLTGDTTVDEGGTATYSVDLAGTLQHGEQATVSLAVNDIDTTSADYSDFIAAVNSATLGRSDLVFDGSSGTLTYTGDGNAFNSFEIRLIAHDDSYVEGPELLRVELLNASSTTGSTVEIAPTAGTVVTTIRDTVGDGGVLEQAVWSLVGDSSVDEGADASFVLSLAGTMQADESASVVLSLTDITTNANDHAALLSSIEASLLSSNRPDLSFDSTTGELTFTSTGSAMADFNFTVTAVNDSLLEGPEDYRVTIDIPNSATGSRVVVSDSAFEANVTIVDLQSPGGPIEGPGEWTISGDATVDEGGMANYLISLSGAFGGDETAQVHLSIDNIDASTADYDDFWSIVQLSVDAYNSDPGQMGSLALDATAGTLTWTSTADGDTFGGLSISLPAIDDSFSEGPEQYSVSLSNAFSSTNAPIAVGSASSVLTQINDTQGVGGLVDGPNRWSIVGVATADEGAIADYVISLSGSFGAGENASIDVSLIDVDTTSSDYSSASTALQAAVAAYSGPGSVTLVGNSLWFTASSDGDSMSDLRLQLPIVDDNLIEGPESYSWQLSSAQSTTGANVAIASGQDSVTTVIADTQGVAGNIDGPAEWSISGSSAVDEGDSAQFTISLTGSFGANESASIQIDWTDLSTRPDDYANIANAITAAAANDPAMNFDPATGILTFSAASDGSTMTDFVFDIPIVDDAWIEGPESFSMQLSEPNSTTGANVSLSPNDSVTTTIRDTQGPAGEFDGPAEWSITGPSEQNEGTGASYSIALNGSYQSGESTSIVVTLADIDTTSSDYGILTEALVAAVANRPDLQFDPGSGTLTFTAPLDGASMPSLDFELAIQTDLANEAPEDFVIRLSSPSSSTGLSPSVSNSASEVTTTINSPPVAQPDSLLTQIDQPASGSVVSNDWSSNGTPLTVTQVNGTPVTGQPIPTANGSVMMNQDGTFTYTPSPGFTGTDSFTYEVCDDNGLCDESTVTIEVRNATDPNTPGNTPPIATDDVASGFVDQPITGNLLSNDGDPNGDAITIDTTPISGPTNGTVSIQVDGSFIYTPNAGFEGTDTFVYEIFDAAGNRDTATVTLSVSPDPTPGVNDAPRAANDAGIGQKNGVVQGDLLANDSDPNGDALTVNTTPVQGPSNGTLVIHPDGTYTYTPDPNFVGNDSFTYEVCDSFGVCDTATVELIIFNQAPVALDDFARTPIGEPVTVPVTDNDVDPNGDPLTVIVLSVDQGGAASVQPDGSILFTPNLDFVGTTTIRYLVEDPNGATSTAQVTIEVFLPYTWDSNHNFSKDFDLDVGGTNPFHQPLLTQQIFTLASEPIFSGYSRPGTQVVGRIYDQSGQLIGESFAYSDVGGNWMMTFRNVEKLERYRVEFDYAIASMDIYGYLGLNPSDNSYQALQPMTNWGRSMTAQDALRDAPQATLQRMHQEHNRPMGTGN